MLADQGKIHSKNTSAPSGDAESSSAPRILHADIKPHTSALDAIPQSKILADEGASVFIYSSDPDFQSAVEAAAGDQYAITPIEDWAALVAAVESGDCKIVLLDVDTMRGRVEWRILKLQAAATWSVVMIAASRERATNLMELLWQHRIHRLVLKPLGFGVTRILMESAVVRFRQLRDDRSLVADAAVEKQSLLSRLAARFRLPNPQRVATYVILLVAVGLTAAVLIVPLLAPLPAPSLDESIATETVVAPAAPAAPAEPEADRAAEQLQLATRALSEGRVTTPEGDSALDYYAAAVLSDPENSDALAELSSLLNELFAEAESSLLSESLGRAEITLNHIRRVQPESTRLSFLDRQLERSRAQESDPLDVPTFDLNSSLPVVAAIPSLSELDSLLTVAEVRLQSGQLTLPVGDSALDYLQRAEALSPDDPIVLEFRPELGEALAVSARVALDSGDLEDAESRIDTARSLGAATGPLDALVTEIAAIRATADEQVVVTRHATLFTDAQARLVSGAFLEPEEDSAYFYLTNLTAESPDYPELDASWQRLLDGVAASAADAIGEGDWTAGESLLEDLARIDPESEQLTELRTELEVSQLRDQYLTVAAPPSDMVLLASEPLIYPPSAHVASIQGWVDLDFIVDLDGNVSDITVAGAEPEGEFEQAAIDALSTYRFEPFELDGRIYERRLRLRTRFALE